MKKLFPALALVFCVLFLFISVPKSSSDELDDVTKQLNTLQDSLNQSVKATKPLESQVLAMQGQIAAIKSQVANIDVSIIQKKKDIDLGYNNLKKQERAFNEAVKDYYIKSYASSPIQIFLSTKSASDFTQTMAYQKAATDQDKQIITNLAITISELEIKKKNLEIEQNRLVGVKANLDAQSAKLDKVIVEAKAYQSSVSGQIAQLSAKQQQLLAAKLSSLNIPQTAYTSQGGCVDDRNIDPGFSPRFAAFTFGVPNRVGLNQYGAKGRAQAGQSAETILSAYYNADLKKDYDSGINIHVTGSNEYGQSFDTNWNIEEYVKHIYEMPTSWAPEALKAQAVAARSYALAVTNNGSSSICPSQSCQVVKQEINSDAWKAAVDSTRGWVLTSGGQPIKAWFSSTHGGYSFSSSDIGWSSTPYTKAFYDGNGSVNSFSDLQSNAYDKESPWFYCDWGSRASYNKTAWLKPEELADIVNVISLAKADSSTVSHLSQLDKSNPDGTDTWDSGKVRQELQNRNQTALTSISSVSVDFNKSNGKVSGVSISGAGGNVSFDGSTFKSFFNLRAPANIQIVGPLYNIEQK